MPRQDRRYTSEPYVRSSSFLSLESTYWRQLRSLTFPWKLQHNFIGKITVRQIKNSLIKKVFDLLSF